jgi:predicted ATPase
MSIPSTPERRATNWYVITGGPGAGKTTTVNILRERGYTTTIEGARHYIDTLRKDGHDPAEERRNQERFQMEVLRFQIRQEESLDPDQLVFLDRAIPDALAYFRFLYLPLNKTLTDALATVHYRKVFFLECLPLVNDYARGEDETQQKRLRDLLHEVYHSLPFPLVHIPVLPAEERVDFILANL